MSREKSFRGSDSPRRPTRSVYSSLDYKFSRPPAELARENFPSAEYGLRIACASRGAAVKPSEFLLPADSSLRSPIKNRLKQFSRLKIVQAKVAIAFTNYGHAPHPPRTVARSVPSVAPSPFTSEEPPVPHPLKRIVRSTPSTK